MTATAKLQSPLNKREIETDSMKERVMKSLRDPNTWKSFHNQVQKYMNEGATKEQACEWEMQD